MSFKSAIKKAVYNLGYEIRRRDLSKLPPANLVRPMFDKAHYGCYDKFLAGWVNVDAYIANGPENFVQANLATRHPFPDECFRFGFAEDFLEHLNQADSLTFLSEVWRTFKPGGVLRLSFPGLEAVLRDHYTPTDFDTVIAGKTYAYDRWVHEHFYSRAELTTVAEHFGFAVEFVKMSVSRHPELHGLDTRLEQETWNICAELTKH